LIQDSRIVWIGDAKYKRLPVGGNQKADLYQLLAYAVALDLPGGTIVYASDPVSCAEHSIGNKKAILDFDYARFMFTNQGIWCMFVNRERML
jgi:5-methylcytosine-specific restriction endonuclease McrBC regulatory subunit McrC